MFGSIDSAASVCSPDYFAGTRKPSPPWSQCHPSVQRAETLPSTQQEERPLSGNSTPGTLLPSRKWMIRPCRMASASSVSISTTIP